MEALAAALALEVLDERLSPAMLGVLVRASETILVQVGIGRSLRGPTIAHECSHHMLHARAPHDEVWYLACAILVPRELVARIPPHRPVTAAALRAAAPWPVPVWIAEHRAAILRRAEEAA